MPVSNAVYQSSAVATRHQCERWHPFMPYNTASYKGSPTVCPICGKMKLITLTLHFALNPTSYCDSETCGVILQQFLSYCI